MGAKVRINEWELIYELESAPKPFDQYEFIAELGDDVVADILATADKFAQHQALIKSLHHAWQIRGVEG